MFLKNLFAKTLFFVLISILFDFHGPISNKTDANEMQLPNTKSSLPIDYRLAFMTGHVETGIELYRLNELKMAAPHLLHPISEIHSAERKGLEKLGLKKNIFKQVSNSLDNNLPASEIESLLEEASNNLSTLAKKVNGDSEKIIIFLLKTTIEEYNLCCKNNKIINIGEYQDAWGFVKVAMYHAKNITNSELSKGTMKKLKFLHKYWSNGPLPVKNPTEPSTIKKSAESIIQKLNF